MRITDLMREIGQCLDHCDQPAEYRRLAILLGNLNRMLTAGAEVPDDLLAVLSQSHRRLLLRGYMAGLLALIRESQGTGGR